MSTRAFWVPDELWPRLIDEHSDPATLAGPYRVEHVTRPLAELVATAVMRERIEQARVWLSAEGDRALLVVRGPAGSGREALARALAAALGPLHDHSRSRAPRRFQRASAPASRAALVGAALIVDARGERPPALSVELPANLPGPVLWLDARAGLEQIPSTNSGRCLRTIELERFGVAERAQLWALAIPAAQRSPSLELDHFASAYRFGPGRVFAAAALARARVSQGADGESPTISSTQLEVACRELPTSSLAGLARRLPRPYVREDLVVGNDLRRELDLVRAWARHGRQVFGDWGLAERMPTARGLACLFVGPPGTGKTMAAQVLAAELHLELIRVDLSSVVSKYIGETEKNLSRVFDEAESAGAMLFFDEADALFGRRSEVKDAHDRYANIEVGYLLQRLEIHEGVTILATNLRRNIDEAFVRRLQIIAEFPIPKAADRMKIWAWHLPREHADDIDVEFLGTRFEIAGGDIRNAVLCAAFLAAEDGELVSMWHLVQGLARELRKGGRLLDPDAFGPWAGVCRQTRPD